MFEFGEIVKVRTFIDGIVERRVVGGVDATVFLCDESEFQSARKGNREPVAIGFPVADVILDDEKKKAA